MPELAEVEYNRKQWDPGLAQRVLKVAAHPEKRVYRNSDVATLIRTLTSAKLLGSEAQGKQMLFRFSRQAWLGVHLGMTGHLRVEPPDFQPSRHDHLVLFQRERALVFADPRQFGRLRFDLGARPPAWWNDMPAPVTGPEFTLATLEHFLKKHARLPLKATLLHQAGFPGIGNWMADEILWRCHLHPRQPAGTLDRASNRQLWRQVRWVSRKALSYVGQDYSDLPRTWFFHERWTNKGTCPIHRVRLERAVIGGRTTAWCAQCQPAGKQSRAKPRKPRI